MLDPGVTQLLYLVDESFDANAEHSLLGNLRNVDAATWSVQPRGGNRTIRHIVDHAGVGIRLYGNHLFGDATLDYLAVHRASPGRADPDTIPAVRAWLQAGHADFRAGVEKLSDQDLTRVARAHYGEAAEIRWLIGVVIQHNVYHAGEINHLRALLQHDDRWPGAPDLADSG
jgi:uncharacterized damage-inducible protein DinB